MIITYDLQRHASLQGGVSLVSLGNQLENKVDVIEFVFPKEWEGYSKQFGAVHENGTDKYLAPMLENKIDIIDDITQISGAWYMYIILQKNDVRIVTDYVLGIVDSNDVKDLESTVIDPNIQFAYEKMLELNNTLKHAYETGQLKGEKGDKGDTGLQGPQGIPGEATTEFKQMVEQSTLNATKAEQSASQAKLAETNAKTSEDKVKASETNAKLNADKAATEVAKVQDNIAQIEQNKKDILSFAIKNKNSGNPCILNDSTDKQILGLNIYGESEQTQTTGAQLFNKETRIVGKIIDGNTGDELSNDRYACSDFIEIPQGTKNLYQTNGAINQRAFYDENKSFISKPNNNNTIVPDNVKYIRITSDIDKQDMTNIMLNEGSTAKPYEPYTGGKPSPSPDYPQDIVNKEFREIKVTGKNLIPFPYPLMPTITNKLGVKIEVMDDGGIYVKGTCSEDKNIVLDLCNGDFGDNDMDSISNGSNDDYTISLYPKNSKIKLVYQGSDNSVRLHIYQQNAFNDIFYPQIELGGKQTPYEKNKEQKLKLSKAIAINAVNDNKVVDIINTKDGVVERNVKEIVITGDEMFNGNYQSPLGFYGRYIDDEFGNLAVDDKIASNILPYVRFSWTQSKEGICQNMKQLHIKFSNERLGITDNTPLEEKQIAFSNYLKTLSASGKPMIVLIGVIKTKEPLPQADQEAIKKLHTYYPNTVINTNAFAKVEYVADTKLYIDNVIAKYHAQAQASQLAMMSLLPDETQATMIEKDQENLLGGLNNEK